ncbi:MAG: hypothetical protein ACPGOY_00485 [Rhodospirillaceae bacterium]
MTEDPNNAEGGLGPWDHAPVGSTLGKARAAMLRGDFAAALEAFQSASDADEGDGSAAFGVASASFFLGAWDDAERWFLLAKRLDPTFQVTAGFRANDVTQLQPAPSHDALSPLEIRPAANDPERPMVLVACDEAYCRYYALPLLLSLASLAPGWGAHLHIVDPNAQSIETVEALAKATPGLALSLSWEFAGLDALPQALVKPYLASARFLRLPALLDALALKVPLVILDADALINRDPASLLSGARDAFGAQNGWDWALHETGYFGHGPLMHHWAACVGIAPGQRAKQAADHLAAVLQRAFAEQTGHWMIDQFALLVAMRAAQENIQGFQLHPWPETVFRPDRSDPEMAVWSFGAARKKTDPVFREAALKWFTQLGGAPTA